MSAPDEENPIATQAEYTKYIKYKRYSEVRLLEDICLPFLEDVCLYPFVIVCVLIALEFILSL